MAPKVDLNHLKPENSNDKDEPIVEYAAEDITKAPAKQAAKPITKPIIEDLDWLYFAFLLFVINFM